MSTPAPASARFASASRRVTEWLAQHTAVAQWSVARVGEDRETHLHVAGEGPLVPGRSMEWSSTLCRRMVAGAPRVVADARLDPAYADLELTAEFPGYAGTPILDEHGELFGVLCGLDAEPIDRPEDIDQSMLALLSGLLTDVLASARDLDRAEDAVAHAADHRDRRADRPAQPARLAGACRRHERTPSRAGRPVRGHGGRPRPARRRPAERPARGPREPCRGSSAQRRRAGRGGRERAAARGARDRRHRPDRAEQFAVLFDGCGEEEAGRRVVEVRSALLMAGIAASVGWAAAPPQVDVSGVLAHADERMSAEKRLRSTVG